ncbi:MAG: hypothetical protein RKO66_05455, partial [Candidatus Contendobacter sp.]|nr:hypothetical protein [Candidatus Contendobacter sp.]MDS4058218.1 hypothetical protein [Candidatus Contendobacter sp.]
MPRLSEIEDQATSPADEDRLLVVVGGNLVKNSRGDLFRNQRTTTSATTGTLQEGESAAVRFTVPTSVEILAVESSGPARVRLYSSEAALAADSARSRTTRPTPGIGLILETVHEAASTVVLDPHAHGSNMENP